MAGASHCPYPEAGEKLPFPEHTQAGRQVAARRGALQDNPVRINAEAIPVFPQIPHRVRQLHQGLRISDGRHTVAQQGAWYPLARNCMAMGSASGPKPYNSLLRDRSALQAVSALDSSPGISEKIGVQLPSVGYPVSSHQNGFMYHHDPPVL